MEDAITYAQLAWIIVFIIVVGVGFFAAIALKSLNQLLKNTNTILEGNIENFNRIIPNLADISDDGRVIAGDMKIMVDEATVAVDQLTHTTRETMLKLNQTADNVGTYAVFAGEIAKVLVDLYKEKKLKA